MNRTFQLQNTFFIVEKGTNYDDFLHVNTYGSSMRPVRAIMEGVCSFLTLVCMCVWVYVYI